MTNFKLLKALNETCPSCSRPLRNWGKVLWNYDKIRIMYENLHCIECDKTFVMLIDIKDLETDKEKLKEERIN